MGSPGRYRADIGGGSLKLRESRIIADLLIAGIDEAAWNHAIMVDNVLQTTSPNTAKRQARLLRSRLETMERDLWGLVRDGSSAEATQALFASAIKHSPLLGDFLLLVVKEHFRLFSPTLPIRLWNKYLDDCRARDPQMTSWSESTAKRLGGTVYRILLEVGLLRDTKSTVLQPVRILASVRNYLRKHKEQYVLDCIQVAP
ncbi:MAG: DUF1819 family protein [Pseudomonadota bacterium]